MHKTKKKKTVKLPKPIKVKKEKSDEDRLPQPMTHYIDDRLEMVKQIFNTLQPKTIINLAPDFLKSQTLEVIEEACLNELLCISTKRLKSIITATKCPTDTESSDDDSDVERQEEHISLEEISSDSDIDESSSKRAKKKKSETDGLKKDTPNENSPEDTQISVLELLELQARARAIRSQLALEPVTKIEVDSDEEEKNENRKKLSKKSENIPNNERKRLSSESESRDSAQTSRTKVISNDKDGGKHNSKRIKLKRNYRNSNNNIKEEDVKNKGGNLNVIDATSEGDRQTVKKAIKQHEDNKNQEPIIQDIKKEKVNRSPSPDVIPIVAEPETLFITDSSDEEHKKTNRKESKDLANVQPISKVIQQETKIDSNCIEKEPGELDECMESSLTQETDTTEKQSDISAQDNASIENSVKNNQNPQCQINDENVSQDIKIENSKLKDIAREKLKADEINSTNQSDDDQNDDVISLGGDLESEMNEQLEKEVNAVPSPYNKTPSEVSSQDNNKQQDESQLDDAISLESSEDERLADGQSWHSRYMKSSKVSKVLAASRLGKRVRDKIKKSKHSKKDSSNENSDAERIKSTPVFTSKHEDGSIEQYKELLEMRQHKA